MALSSFYDTMGDGDDNVTHGTQEEPHEVSDKFDYITDLHSERNCALLKSIKPEYKLTFKL